MAHRVATAFLVAIVFFSGCNKPAANSEQVIGENRELDKEFVSALKTKDLDRLMNCYWKSPETIVYPSDDLNGLKGYDAIRAGMKHMLDGADRIIAFELSDTRHRVRGTAVFGSGKYLLRLQPKGSPQEMEIVGRYSDIREFKNDRWVYVYDHKSMTPTPGLDVAQMPIR